MYKRRRKNTPPCFLFETMILCRKNFLKRDCFSFIDIYVGCCSTYLIVCMCVCWSLKLISRNFYLRLMDFGEKRFFLCIFLHWCILCNSLVSDFFFVLFSNLLIVGELVPDFSSSSSRWDNFLQFLVSPLCVKNPQGCHRWNEMRDFYWLEEKLESESTLVWGACAVVNILFFCMVFFFFLIIWKLGFLFAFDISTLTFSFLFYLVNFHLQI